MTVFLTASFGGWWCSVIAYLRACFLFSTIRILDVTLYLELARRWLCWPGDPRRLIGLITGCLVLGASAGYTWGGKAHCQDQLLRGRRWRIPVSCWLFSALGGC
jgi:hypothetical protein